ncbi:MAG: FlgD immunoglobulin-like domain containing protein, partial [Rubricoccaceae bacterium]|nr:FlgD immunoglobulin-like domain containing protein [Rubricoccaceae bacterium]
GYSTFGPLADVEFYEPDMGGVMLADLPESRGGLAGTSAAGLVYAIGGRNSSNEILDRVDIYNPVLDEWMSGQALPEPREGAAAVSVDNTIYLFGGVTEAGIFPTTSLSLNVSTSNEELPVQTVEIELRSANPFRSEIVFSVAITEPSSTTVSVYDALGRQLAVLADDVLPAGSHVFQWDGTNSNGGQLPAGTYLISVRTPDSVELLRVTRIQ